MIRKVTGQDLPTIVDIENLSFTIPWPDFLFRSHLSDKGFVLYEQDGIVLGYALIDLNNDTAHLQSIAVYPRYRRLGIGTGLLNWCIKFGKEHGARMITLEVREKNNMGQMFYLKNGFRIKGIVPGYYIDDNAVVMDKEI